jgi:hypothetical protein
MRLPFTTTVPLATSRFVREDAHRVLLGCVRLDDGAAAEQDLVGMGVVPVRR